MKPPLASVGTQARGQVRFVDFERLEANVLKAATRIEIEPLETAAGVVFL